MKLIFKDVQFSKGNLEDRHLVCEEEGFFGVADGVGGWRKFGVNPALFAEELINNCKSIIKNRSSFNLIDIVKKANDSINNSGASTLCLINIKNNILKTYNLGDSGVIVIRKKKVVYKSKEKSHGFNHPFQLARYRGKKEKDSPEDGIEEQFELEEGDIIFLATDGLFDNLFQDEIIKEFRDEPNFSVAVQRVAEKAYTHSTNSEKETPFSKKAGRLGGKPDDITLIGIKLGD